MSANYTCNQFDNAYKPTRLGNWEVPKWHLNRPKGRSTVTKVIANDKGHLLPGVHKTDQKHWAGLYLGTYQLPKRISKENAKELSDPKCQTWMKRSYHHPFIDRGQRNKDGNDKIENNKLENIYTKEQSVKNEETDRDSIKSVKSVISNESAKVSPIETVRKCKSANGCLSATNDDDTGSGVVRGVQVGRSSRTPSSPALSRISAGGGGDRGRDADKDDGGGLGTPVAETPGPPGRRYGDAQRHHGLPDAIEDAVYRSLQTKRHKHPGLGLNGCWPKCSAVAYKSFNDPGPTQCSKLRVYRPRTSSTAADREKNESAGRRAGGGGDESRPKTCVPVMAADQLTDIKLALCWDLDAPFDRNRPPDEPAVFHKVRQQQGGNGCGGGERKPQNSSAVMGFVTAVGGNGDGGDDVGDSRAAVVPEARRMQTRECLLRNRNLSAVMELIPSKDAERNDDVTAASVPDKPPSSSSSTVRRSRSGSNTSRRADRDEAKSNDGGKRPDEHDEDCGGGGGAGAGSEDARHPTGRARRHQDAEREAAAANSHPQRRRGCRPCLACDHPAIGRRDLPDECNHYKMAFKAGVPVSTPVKHRAAKHLKVPKPRTTNSDKKKYVIGTLLPPFSMWPGTTARDYPEHWRLTSVYRQAFKPLELRKQPFLQTIYL